MTWQPSTAQPPRHACTVELYSLYILYILYSLYSSTALYSLQPLQQPSGAIKGATRPA